MVKDASRSLGDRVWWIAAALLIVLIWVVVGARALPTRLGDRGIFVSVAEHLLRGETLYVGTYDNKEPLFFYFIALQRAFGAWAEVLAEVGLIAICSLAIYALARSISSYRSSLLAGFVIVPVIVTGTFYFPGGTALPATAVILASLAALNAGYSGMAGGLIGLVFLLKIPAIPVALATALILLAIRWQPAEWARFASGACLVGAALAGVMAWRGELLPFIETIRSNISYAQGALIENSNFVRGMIVHISRVTGRDFYTLILATCLAMALAVVAHPATSPANRSTRAIQLVCAAALGSALFSLALTGLWWHHNQILYVAAALSAVAMSRFLDLAHDRSPFSVLVVALTMAYMLGGAFPLRAHVTALRDFSKEYAELKRVAPETARLLAVAPSGTYARIGRYDERGHAIGLSSWKLACPRFHQGFFEPPHILQQSFNCASKVSVLLIGDDFTVNAETANWPSWNAYVQNVEKLLAAEYTCDSPTGLRVCVRRN